MVLLCFCRGLQMGTQRSTIPSSSAYIGLIAEVLLVTIKRLVRGFAEAP